MAERTSSVAEAITSMAGLGSAAAALSFSRRSTFSTPTTASSTSSPMAMAKPPSVMVLIVRPKYLNTSTVTRIETGMAVSEMIVVRTFSRKANSTIATMMAPSRSASATLAIEFSMKSACLNKVCGAWMPGGRLLPKSASAASISRVSLTVSAAGCFCTARMTAGCPWKLASPRLMPAASRTSATCDKAMG